MSNQVHHIRNPQFAGSFYSDNTQELIKTVSSFFAKETEPDFAKVKPFLTMLPHAGHIYSGHVTAKTLSEIELGSRIIILCPNHRGVGKNYGVWPSGAWQNSIGQIPIDIDLAEKIVENSPFTFDQQAHIAEHSIEVILPFLQYTVPILYIIPISISSLENVEAAASKLAEVIKNSDKDISIIVSSDMNHFAGEEENRRKDNLALEAFLAGDVLKLLDIVNKENISMCGVLPAVLGLMVAKKFGISNSKLAAYDTSASAFGDSARVVGYAGAYFW